MLPQGGTLLGTRRGSPFDHPDGVEQVQAHLRRAAASTRLIVDRRQRVADGRLQLFYEQLGLPIVGVPKTIDNDIVGTDVTFGFHTAVQIATDAIDRLHTTAESHDRVMVVEVMGRHAGWIATYAGHRRRRQRRSSIPEQPFDIDEVCDDPARRHERGRYASIVVVAEGAEPQAGTLDAARARGTTSFGHVRLGGIADQIAPEIEAPHRLRDPGRRCSATSSGAARRRAYDRVLSTRYGLAAIDAVHDQAWGEMVVFREQRIERAPMSECVGRTRTLDMACTTTWPRCSSADIDCGARGAAVRRRVDHLRHCPSGASRRRRGAADTGNFVCLTNCFPAYWRTCTTTPPRPWTSRARRGACASASPAWPACCAARTSTASAPPSTPPSPRSTVRAR